MGQEVAKTIISDMTAGIIPPNGMPPHLPVAFIITGYY